MIVLEDGGWIGCVLDPLHVLICFLIGWRCPAPDITIIWLIYNVVQCVVLMVSLRLWIRHVIDCIGLARSQQNAARVSAVERFSRQLSALPPFHAHLLPNFMSLVVERALEAVGSLIPAIDDAPAPQSLEAKRADLSAALGPQLALWPFRLGTVRRQSLLEDSLARLAALDRRAAIHARGKVAVRFKGELGIGQGVTRDWFDVVGVALCASANQQEDISLLSVAADGTLVPSPRRPGPKMPARASGDGDAESGEAGVRYGWRDYFAVGRYLALAVLNRAPVPVPLSAVMLKFLLKHKVSAEDVRAVDPDFYRHRLQILAQPGGVEALESIICQPLFFVSAPTDLRREPVPLFEGGESVRVTEENKARYVELVSEDFLCGDFRRELTCILCGFWDILPCAS